jgi:glycerophosphoryl diester phosphodiesterase
VDVSYHSPFSIKTASIHLKVGAMSVRGKLQNALMAGADMAYALWPISSPEMNLLRRCRLISHRGEHNGRDILENTILAFDGALAAGVWGLELDVRWTRDLHPVVVHDADLRRVFGRNQRVAELTLNELQSVCPQVPSLAQVIDRYGRRAHLMVEIKQEPYPKPQRQSDILADLFRQLTAGQDYHLLSLTPRMFDMVAFVPRSACFPIAQTRVAAFSRMATEGGFGGLFGHYSLVKDALVREHHQKRQKIGTGYIGSRNCLFREVRRGVDFIFSNCAARMQKMVNQLLESSSERSIKP